MPLSRSASSRVAMPFSVATRWPFASRAVATSNDRAPSRLLLGCCGGGGCRRLGCCCDSCGGRGGGFGIGLALLARQGLFRIVAGGALDHAGGIEETRHAVGRLRALGEPGFGLVHVELQPRLVVLR